MSNKDLVSKIVDIFNTGDLSEVDSIFSSEYIDHQRPEELNIQGPEEFKQIVGFVRKANFNVTIEDLIEGEDKITLRLQWNNATLSRETIDILRFSNNQVVEHWGAESWKKEK